MFKLIVLIVGGFVVASFAPQAITEISRILTNSDFPEFVPYTSQVLMAAYTLLVALFASSFNSVINNDTTSMEFDKEEVDKISAAVAKRIAPMISELTVDHRKLAANIGSKIEERLSSMDSLDEGNTGKLAEHFGKLLQMDTSSIKRKISDIREGIEGVASISEDFDLDETGESIDQVVSMNEALMKLKRDLTFKA